MGSLTRLLAASRSFAAFDRRFAIRLAEAPLIACAHFETACAQAHNRSDSRAATTIRFSAPVDRWRRGSSRSESDCRPSLFGVLRAFRAGTRCRRRTNTRCVHAHGGRGVTQTRARAAASLSHLLKGRGPIDDGGLLVNLGVERGFPLVLVLVLRLHARAPGRRASSGCIGQLKPPDSANLRFLTRFYQNCVFDFGSHQPDGDPAGLSAQPRRRLVAPALPAAPPRG